MTYRHKYVWKGCPWPPALWPNWEEEAGWRRERSARVWQAIQCFALLCCLDRDVTNRYLAKYGEASQLKRDLLMQRRRARAAQALQAIQCWLLMCCCDRMCSQEFSWAMDWLVARQHRRPSP